MLRQQTNRPSNPPIGAPATFTSFGELLKFLRRRSRLTQRDLALAVGYTEAHVCRLEKNYRPP
ncbi:MAG: helix-turn-helix domain-containing protein, partial [Chloroflexi bacterium]|nr:helix-turn-helix domain-containing protein [Chloroflexota bacterium]MCI0644377.1 helix-turn-helix domain-containing protein [Chloroflexota bacterium]MCI0727370.1 helix-turn-helix domain-containing protein [Chloroflexota bacterium]